MNRFLQVRQLDATLEPWRALAGSRPARGWLRALRQTLGMTTRQLAASVGVTQAAVMDAERAEARGDITLSTLRRYAEALDCELTYALVPRQPLQKMIEQRADRIARNEIARVRHTMELEEQGTGDDERARAVATLRQQILDGRPSRLWR
jgi:predicted DNA-binding mobile mystery protein A